jgi:hypothetical protein
VPIYNVTVTFETTMVVIAEDGDDAKNVARSHALSAVQDADEAPVVDVRGEVTKEEHLRDGWDLDSYPYGGEGHYRLRNLLTHNTVVQADSRGPMREVAPRTES